MKCNQILVICNFLLVCGIISCSTIDTADSNNSSLQISNESTTPMTKEQFETCIKQKYARVGEKSYVLLEAYHERLAGILAKTKRIGKKQFSLLPYISSEVNSIPLPDGTIFISSSLLELLEDDELRYLIAYEMALIENGILENLLAEAIRKSSGGVSDAACLQIERALFESEISKDVAKTCDAYAIKAMPVGRNISIIKASTIEKLEALSLSPRILSFIVKTPAEKVLTVSRPVRETEAITNEIPEDFYDYQVEEAKVEEAKRRTKLEIREEKIEPKTELPIKKELQELKKVETIREGLKGWFIQVSAEKSIAEGQVKRDKLKDGGLNAQIQSAIVNGITYHRVLIGPFSSRKEAQDNLLQVESLGVGEEEPFIRSLK